MELVYVSFSWRHQVNETHITYTDVTCRLWTAVTKCNSLLYLTLYCRSLYSQLHIRLNKGNVLVWCQWEHVDKSCGHDIKLLHSCILLSQPGIHCYVWFSRFTFRYYEFIGKTLREQVYRVHCYKVCLYI